MLQLVKTREYKGDAVLVFFLEHMAKQIKGPWWKIRDVSHVQTRRVIQSLVSHGHACIHINIVGVHSSQVDQTYEQDASAQFSLMLISSFSKEDAEALWYQLLCVIFNS